MAERRIEELPLIVDPNGNTAFPVEQDGVAKRMSLQDMRNYVFEHGADTVVVTFANFQASMTSSEIFAQASLGRNIVLRMQDENVSYDAPLAMAAEHICLFARNSANATNTYTVDENGAVSIAVNTYVRTNASDTIGGNYRLNLDYTPSNNKHAVNKKYVDDAVNTAVENLDIGVSSVNGQTGNVVIPVGNPDAVLYTPMNLTSAQQAQARANIGASAIGDSGETLLGQTPLKLANPATIILRGTGETSFTAKSDTVAVFDPTAGTLNNATVTQTGGMFELAAGSGATAWYQSYVDVTIGGLTAGETYNLVFDGQGVPNDDSQHTGIGHYILYDGNGNTLVTRGATDGARLNSYAFTASTANVRLRWYPATNNTFSAGVSKAYANRIYINAANTTGYTPVVSLSGSFTGETALRSLPAGVTINATPACSVYQKDDGDEPTKPLAGKTVVVFGDSLIGMVRDDTSATAAIAERTGATVYNVGFGGCRMSDHPSHGYAEFSMWALAKAIADNDWTAQETYASHGSDYFPEQLAVLEGIDFSEVDYAVIHYGTNDFGGGVAIGESSTASDHATLCGALRYSIEALLGAYPKLRIFVSLPCFRFWTVDGQPVYSDTYTNSQNKTLVEYVAALRAVAGEYNIPVIENYTGNGINKVNASTFLGDGTHHNADGRERFGTYIAENLISGGSSGIAAAGSNSFGGGS